MSLVYPNEVRSLYLLLSQGDQGKIVGAGRGRLHDTGNASDIEIKRVSRIATDSLSQPILPMAQVVMHVAKGHERH